MSAPAAEAFYDDVWQRYGELDSASPAAFHRRRLVRKLALEFAPLAHDVLDAGCGQGELLRVLGLALPGARLAGADVSSESRRVAQLRNPNASFFALDLLAPDFESVHAARLGRYDLVVCSEVLEHLADDALAVARLRLLLSEGGHLIVTVPGGKKSRFDELIGHLRHYDVRRLDSLLDEQGFAKVRVFAWGFPFHNAYRTAVRVASRFAFRRSGATGANDSGGVGGVLGKAYALGSRLLKPLYYLNRPYWGEQLVAVARRR